MKWGERGAYQPPKREKEGGSEREKGVSERGEREREEGGLRGMTYLPH